MDGPMKEKKYHCGQCQYKASENATLRRHVEAIHEGAKYPSKYCDYKATLKGTLTIHIKSIHEDARYPCDIVKPVPKTQPSPNPVPNQFQGDWG